MKKLKRSRVPFFSAPPILSIVILSAVLTGCGWSPFSSSRDYTIRGDQFIKKGKYAEAALQYRQALNKDTHNAEAHYGLGVAADAKGDPAEAITEFQKAFQLKPKLIIAEARLASLVLSEYLKDPSRAGSLPQTLGVFAHDLLASRTYAYHGYRIQGYLAMSTADPAAAIEKFTAALAERPGEVDVETVLIQNLILAGRGSDAEKSAAEFLKRYPAAGPVYDSLYGYFASLGRRAEAEQLLLLKAKNNPTSALFLLQLADHYRGVEPAAAEAVIGQLLNDAAYLPEGPVLGGDYYARGGDWKNAERAYQLGLDRHPLDTAILKKKMASLSIAQSNTNRAAKLLDEVIADNPDDADALSSRASLRMAGRNRTEMEAARQTFERLVATHPDRFDFLFSLARSERQLKHTNAALAGFRDLVRRQPDNAASLTELASLSLENRAAEDALRYVQQALELNPGQPELRLIRTGAWALMGRRTEIRAELGKLLLEYPNLRQAKVQLATLNLEENKYSDAERLYQQVYVTGAADLGVLRGLAVLYVNQHQNAKALELIQKEAAATPTPDILRLLADVAAESGRLEIAIDAIRRVASEDPGDVEAAIQLGLLQRRAGNKSEALAELMRAVKLDSRNARAHAVLGDVQVESGTSAAAIASYRAAMRLEPQDPIVMNNLAFQLASTESGRPEALRLINTATQLAPGNAGIVDTIGWIYLQGKQYDAAIRSFRVATKAAPDNSTFQLHLGMALMQKRHPEARSALRAALKTVSVDSEKSEILRLINQLPTQVN